MVNRLELRHLSPLTRKCFYAPPQSGPRISRANRPLKIQKIRKNPSTLGAVLSSKNPVELPERLLGKLWNLVQDNASTSSDARVVPDREQTKGQSVDAQEGWQRRMRRLETRNKLLWLLRHGADREGVWISSDGLVRVDDILTHWWFVARDVTYAEIEDIVNTYRDRFQFYYPGVAIHKDQSQKTALVRAIEGHSMPSMFSNTQLIVSTSELPRQYVACGVSRRQWKAEKTIGIERHEHKDYIFLYNIDGPQHYSSIPVRDIVIYIDMDQAIAEGIKFFSVAADNKEVVITQGDGSSLLRKKYFLRVDFAKWHTLQRRNVGKGRDIFI